MSKAQYITAMTLSVLLMLVAIGGAIGSLGTLSKADEKVMWWFIAEAAKRSTPRTS
jgi:hypothetical protein